VGRGGSVINIKRRFKMNLILWRPDSEVRSLSRTMDRLMEEALTWPVYRPFSFFEDGGYEWLPLDIQKTDDHVVVKASMPGVKLEDVDISISGDVLTIKGEIKSEEETKKAEYVCHERFSGEFSRSVMLPEGLDTEKAEALMENGILTLTIPKSEEAKPKSIKVKATSSKK
jgi:HSP20 family protein